MSNNSSQSIKQIPSQTNVGFSHGVMPHSIEAEEALLGGILVDNEVYNRIIFDIPLKDSHFYIPLNQRIFEGIRKLINQGQVADPITLSHYFEKDLDLTEINDPNHFLGILI